MAHAQRGEIGGEAGGVGEAEIPVELQPIGRPGDGEPAARSFVPLSLLVPGVLISGTPPPPARATRRPTRGRAGRAGHRPRARSRFPPARPRLHVAPERLARSPSRLPSPSCQRTRTAPSPRTAYSPAFPGAPASRGTISARRTARCAGTRRAIRHAVRGLVLPCQLGGAERLRREGIGDPRENCLVAKLGEGCELLPAAFAYRLGEVRLEIAEEGERLGGAPFLAHEQHRDVRRSRYTAATARRHGRRRRRQPVAEGAIADLVVVLDEADEGGRRQVPARLAARRRRRRSGPPHPRRRSPPPAPGRASPRRLGMAGSSRCLAGGGDVEDMMDIVVHWAVYPGRPSGPRASKRATFAPFSRTRWM